MTNQETFPNECEVCESDCETLTSMSCFKGNKDDRMMCDECFKEIHEVDAQATDHEGKI